MAKRHNTRLRVTRATVRRMSEGTVVDLYENARNGIEQADMQMLGPASEARVRRHYPILRAELKRRGFTGDVLDGNTEAEDVGDNHQEDFAGSFKTPLYAPPA